MHGAECHGNFVIIMSDICLRYIDELILSICYMPCLNNVGVSITYGTIEATSVLD